MTEDLRYPIGKFDRNMIVEPSMRPGMIAQIAETPRRLREAVAGLNDAQLDTPYRPEGWTVRQVVHHLPDSHLNSYIRWKLGVTEHEPPIKPYAENKWAELEDAKRLPVEVSLKLLESLHERWVVFLSSLKPEDFARKVNHPEHGLLPLAWFLGLYSWHGRHHVAQITSLRKRMGW